MYCPKCGMAQADEAAFCTNCGRSLAPRSGGVNAVAQVEYAGFWRRFISNLIDGVLVNAMSFIVGLIMGAIIVARHGKMDGPMTAVVYLCALVISVLYWGICESSPSQATLGKMTMGIKVTDMEGNRISFGKAVGRYLGKILSGFILCIGYLMIAFTEKKQGLHDMMAGTLVVLK